MLNLVRAVLIESLMVGYKFDVSKFLAQEIQDRAVGREKLLLAYLCIITQIWLAAGMHEPQGLIISLSLKTL